MARSYKKSEAYRLPPERKAEMLQQIKMWHAFGLRYVEIADKVGLPASTVTVWGREVLGLPKPWYRKSRPSRAKPKPQTVSLPGEEWRSVLGWEGAYQVSSFGRVKGANGLLKNGKPDSKGYIWHALRNGNKYQYRSVHSLVLEAFIGPRPKGMIARHLDGTRRNHLDNLAWGTHSENARDFLEHKAFRERVAAVW